MREVWIIGEVYIKMRRGLRKTGRSKRGFERSMRKNWREVKENLRRVWINSEKFISN